ncbi:MAG: hypothetical protein ABIN80_09375 [Dyadobacter sp.]|uniref:hypothetical protein n=1 Tax=Dyadobacter sp. TaxID=1914288 RepID=UPI0032678230
MTETEITDLAENGVYKATPLKGKVEHTHISWVIISGKNAFKIKKPVALNFLDFSRLKERKGFCEKELRLNQRFSGIYLDVLPVRQTDHSWQIGEGDGKIVDYAVRMKKMAASQRMDKMLRQGRVQTSHILSLVDQIVAFHQNAAVIDRPFDAIEAASNFNDLQSVRPFVEKQLGGNYADIIDLSIQCSDSFLNVYGTRMRERVRLGYQRDLHGDLHSGNIFIYKEPVIFDCIEFNDHFRQIDVLSEVAFFCMDLEYWDQSALSGLFMGQYADRLPCMTSPDDQRIFTYYKIVRANIRAKVHALSAMEDGESENGEELKACRKYLDLMRSYTDSWLALNHE